MKTIFPQIFINFPLEKIEKSMNRKCNFANFASTKSNHIGKIITRSIYGIEIETGSKASINKRSSLSLTDSDFVAVSSSKTESKQRDDEIFHCFVSFC